MQHAINTPFWEPVIDDLQLVGNGAVVQQQSYWIIFVFGFLGGLLALLTPCVWPMIPMTASFFLKSSKNKNKAIKKSAWSARVCQDCKGMPKGTKKISEAEYHAQVAEEMKKAAELNQQTNSRVPYIAKGYIDTQRISMARDNRGSK